MAVDNETPIKTSQGFLQVASIILLGIVALSAFILSFRALAEVFQGIGGDAGTSVLYPVIIDGPMLAATVVIFYLAGREKNGWNRGYAWFVLILFSMISVWMNAIHSLLYEESRFDTITSLVISAMPSVALVFTVHLIAVIIDRQRKTRAKAVSRSTTSAATVASKAGVVPSAPVENTGKSAGAASKSRRGRSAAAPSEILRPIQPVAPATVPSAPDSGNVTVGVTEVPQKQKSDLQLVGLIKRKKAKGTPVRTTDMMMWMGVGSPSVANRKLTELRGAYPEVFEGLRVEADLTSVTGEVPTAASIAAGGAGGVDGSQQVGEVAASGGVVPGGEAVVESGKREGEREFVVPDFTQGITDDDAERVLAGQR